MFGSRGEDVRGRARTGRGDPARFRGASAVACATLAAFAWGCGSPSSHVEDAAPPRAAARVGSEAVPAVRVLENHSSALIAWRSAGVRDRIVVHVDGHADLDWLPDGTIARIAAASPEELPGLELHPYAMDGTTLSRFGIWDWLYPAARLGMIRELVWLVPDGTLAGRDDVVDFVREVIVSKIQMVAVDEARTLHASGRTIRGTLLGLPVVVCELADLPQIDEPVLLDVDLDYFTTRSAKTQEVTETPWIRPAKFVEGLAARGLRTDLVTMSLSTMGGYLPPSCRWLGPDLAERLHSPRDVARDADAGQENAEKELLAGRADRAATLYRGLVERRPDDATLSYGLYRALAAQGRTAEAEAARARAVELDPVLAHDDLFEGDRRWLNHRFDESLEFYRRYLEKNPKSPFAAYALRREGSCLMHLRRDDEAIAALRSALALAPQHADSRMDLGVLLRSRGAIDDAIREISLARKILPDRAIYSLVLGSTYAMTGRNEEAVEELQHAVDRQPCLALARNNLAIALFQLGRYDEAAKNLRIAMAFTPAPSPQMMQLAGQLGRRGVPISRVSAEP